MALRFARSLGDAVAPAFALAALGLFACRGPEFNTGSGGGAQAGGNAPQGGGGGGGSGPLSITVVFRNNVGPRSGFVVGVNDDTGASIATTVTNSTGKATVTVPEGGWVMVLDDSDPDSMHAYAAKVTSGVSEVVFFGNDVNENTPGELSLSGTCSGCMLGQDDIEFHLSCASTVRRVTTLGNQIQTNSFVGTTSCPDTSTVAATMIAYKSDGTPSASATAIGPAGSLGLNVGPLSAVSASDVASLSLPIADGVGFAKVRRVDALDSAGFAIRSWRDTSPAATKDFKLIKSLATNLRVTQTVEATNLSFISRSQRIPDALADVGTLSATSFAIPKDVPMPSFATAGQPEVALSLGGGDIGDAVTIELIDDANKHWSVTVPPSDVASLRFPRVPDGLDTFIITSASSADALHVDVAEAADYAAYLAGGTFSISAQPLLVQDVTIGSVLTQF